MSVYLSHVVRSLSPAVSRQTGKEEDFCLQVMSKTGSEKRSLCFGTKGDFTFYNANSLEEMIAIAKNLVGRYHPFEYDMLSLGEEGDDDLRHVVLNAFVLKKDIQEEIDRYKLDKDLL
jgi:hypothetical protein